MKLIPCPHCAREALGPKSPAYPDGAPVVFGRYTGGAHPIVVKCFRCKSSWKLDARTYASLPEMSADEVKELAVRK